MHFRKSVVVIAAIAASALEITPSASAADSVSGEFATGNKTKMIRLGAQWNWEKSWFRSNGTQLGGYWDLTLADWRGTRYRNTDQTQNIVDIGITPVFRFQASSRKGMYGEAGVGAHLMSHVYNNNGRRLSTAFEFGDHLAAGYVFTNGLDVGLKVQHFSNGGIKQPNNGVNFAVIRLAYPF
jgi:hypothetical protein